MPVGGDPVVRETNCFNTHAHSQLGQKSSSLSPQDDEKQRKRDEQRVSRVSGGRSIATPPPAHAGDFASARSRRECPNPNSRLRLRIVCSTPATLVMKCSRSRNEPSRPLSRNSRRHDGRCQTLTTGTDSKAGSPPMARAAEAA